MLTTGPEPGTGLPVCESIHVAAGVILNANREVLLALRPKHKHQGGLWEFPGGKVEAAENVQSALARELLEELGIEITESAPMLVTCHDYDDKRVMLDVWLVTGFTGEPAGLEGQEVAWFRIAELDALEFPAANDPIVARLQEIFAHAQAN
jgi:8-oxo-dGTP diphosphatase